MTLNADEIGMLEIALNEKIDALRKHPEYGTESPTAEYLSQRINEYVNLSTKIRKTD